MKTCFAIFFAKGGSAVTGALKILRLTPFTPILALWWIWRLKRVNATRDILTTKVRK